MSPLFYILLLMTLAVDVVSASFPVPLWGKGEMALTVNTIKPDNKKPANCLIPPPFTPSTRAALTLVLATNTFIVHNT